jgi:hypothetical protein
MLWSSKILRVGPSRFCWSWGDLKIYCVTSLLMFKRFKILALLVQLDSPLPYAPRPCWLSLWLQKCYAFFLDTKLVCKCLCLFHFVYIDICYMSFKLTSGTRDLRTLVATPLQPLRTLCLVAIIGNFPKITLVGPTLRHLYPHK